MPSVRNNCYLVCLFGALLATASPLSGQQLTSGHVKDAIHKGVAYIKSQQSPNGSWGTGRNRVGTTAICTLALINAGVPTNDPAVRRGINVLKKNINSHVYTVSLKAQVYAAADPKKYRRQLQKAANYLIAAQLPSGMWTYSKLPKAAARRRRMGDNSNTQFALLGLHQASAAGIAIKLDVWRRSKKHFCDSQNFDGGWGYTPGANSYGSMTTAGLASLYICGQRLMTGRKIFRKGAYPDCGKYARDPFIAKALEWLGTNFSVKQNTGGSNSWKYYYLYGLERAGMISGQQFFGRHDWYRTGAAELVRLQGRNGNWSNRSNIYNSAFALLFLAKGNRPVLFQKLQWDDSPAKWNRNLHDLENLTGFIGEKLGKASTWQSVRLDVPLEQLRMSPVLLITGHEFPKFTPKEIEKLRKFTQTGGTLLFEACCGSKAFAKGFRKFAAKVFPNLPLQPLRKSHPVFSSFYELEDTYGLLGLDSGCRTSVFFSPNALSCLWELETIPKFSDKALELGTNIAAYATGREQLRDKLDVVELPATETKNPTDATAEIPRGAIRIARLVHDGDYNTDPQAMVNLAGLLRKNAKIDVVSRTRHLRPSDKAIYEYPIVFMTGHYAFELSDKDIENLREYLSKGGVLIASNCCGRDEFDKSFRAMTKQLFPKEKLTPLGDDHPIYTGKTGVEIGEVKFRPILAKQLKARGTNTPPLEALNLDKRSVILYSKYDWCCALEGDHPFSCKGYTDKTGQKLAMSIFLYAISY